MIGYLGPLFRGINYRSYMLMNLEFQFLSSILFPSICLLYDDSRKTKSGFLITMRLRFVWYHYLAFLDFLVSLTVVSHRRRRPELGLRRQVVIFWPVKDARCFNSTGCLLLVSANDRVPARLMKVTRIRFRLIS